MQNIFHEIETSHQIFVRYNDWVKVNPERTQWQQFLYEKLVDVSPNGNYVGDELVRMEWQWNGEWFRLVGDKIK